MARVLAVFDDLLLGSNVLGMLRAAGHEAQLSPAAGADATGYDLVIVDLAADNPFDPGGDAKRLGVYSHVHPEQKQRAEEQGFDLVVPRSRMAREGAALIDRVLSPG